MGLDDDPRAGVLLLGKDQHLKAPRPVRARGRDRGRDDYDRYDEGPRRDAYGQPYGGPPQGGGYDRGYDDRGPPPQQRYDERPRYDERGGY